MAVELGGVLLEHLTRVSVNERARIARHGVPGLDGDLSQPLGRSSVEVSVEGIFYGPGAVEDLDRLRGVYLGREPVDFFTEAVGEGYFTRVLVSRLEISQRAGYPDQFDFVCDVTEYVEPPEPVALASLAVPDAASLDEAVAFMDNVQEGLEGVSQLVDLLSPAVFESPVRDLPEMPTEYGQIVGGGVGSLAGIRDLLLGASE